MKSIILDVIFIFLTFTNLIAQQHCSEIVRTTSPTIGFWDWRTPSWECNVRTNGGGDIITSITSPFSGISSDNVNLGSLASNASKDYEPNDGWELIRRQLGKSTDPPISNAYVIFYNKFTSKVRIFFLVNQNFSNTTVSEFNTYKGAIIKIYWEQQDINFVYQSNLLSTFSTPMLPLDQFKRNINIITPNAFFNYIPYWLYSDFPVAYDPCTCQKKGQLRIEAHLLNSADINFTLNSVPQTTPSVENGNVHADFLTGFTQFTSTAEGGLKAARTTGEAFGSLDAAIAKQTGTSIQQKLGLDKGALKTSVDQFGSWLELLPIGGSAIKSVLSLFDFFSGGGNSSSGPAPVYIINNFKATGGITSSTPKQELSLPLPGSNQSNIDASILPVYNNTLGVFNLLFTPTVRLTENRTVTSNSIVSCCAKYDKSGFCTSYSQSGTKVTAQRLSISLDGNPNNLKFTVNPALNIDLLNSDIRAAFIVEDCPYGTTGSSTNLQRDIESKNTSGQIKPIYRSSYFPVGVLTQNLATANVTNIVKEIHDNPYCTVIHSNSTLGGFCDPKVYVKIVARLRRQGFSNPSEDIVFVAKYPSVVTKESTTSTYLDGGLEDKVEDAVLPDNLTINEGAIFTALNALSIGSSSIIDATPFPIFGEIDATLVAGESITIRAGGAISNRYSLKVGGIYPSSVPTLQTLKATSTEINNFCNSPAYVDASNRNVAARVATIPENQEVIGIEKFFTAFPNPTTGKVSFRYYVEEPSQVRLNLVSTTGTIVAAPVDAYQEEGLYELAYDASNLPAGIYIYTLETSKGKETKRLVVIK
jgi:hypothetical protein